MQRVTMEAPKRVPLEQRDLALQPGLQRGWRQLVEPPLQRSAQAVGVAAADIKALRCHFFCRRGDVCFSNSRPAASSSAMTSSPSI